MRKITSSFFMSVDGVVEAPETWQFPYMNYETLAAVSATMAESTPMLLGRAPGGMGGVRRAGSIRWPHT